MTDMIETSDAERARLRKLWRDHWTNYYAQNDAWQTECDRLHDEWVQSAGRRATEFPPQPEHPSLPPELVDLSCGARTRAGTPCKLTTLWVNGRCKFHGGASTGPKTNAGKAIASRNAYKQTP
jgi:hypothetical protein